MIYVVVLNKVFFIGISYKEHAQWSLTWMCLPSHLVEDFSWCTIIIHPWLIHESLLPTHVEWERLWNNVEFIWSHMQHFLFEFPAWIPSFVMSIRTQKSMLHMLFGLNSSKNTNRIPITIGLSSDTLTGEIDFSATLKFKNWRGVESKGMLLEVKLNENQKTEEQWNLKECCWWPNWRKKGEGKKKGGREKLK